MRALFAAFLGFLVTALLATVLVFALLWNKGPNKVGYRLSEAIVAEFGPLFLMVALTALPVFLIARVVLLQSRSAVAFAVVASVACAVAGVVLDVPAGMRPGGEPPHQQVPFSMINLIFWMPVGAALGSLYWKIERIGWATNRVQTGSQKSRQG